jgi:pteridine reductase
MNEIEKNYILENTALKKLGSVQDIANAVRYLINNARYITGQILVIDGGRSLPS